MLAGHTAFQRDPEIAKEVAMNPISEKISSMVRHGSGGRPNGARRSWTNIDLRGL
jgi:hypothetical protein